MKEAFFNDPAVKETALERAVKHTELGRLVRGTYGEFHVQEPGTASFRGCAVGCLCQPLNEVIITNSFSDEWELMKFLERTEQEPVADASDYDGYDKLEEQFNFPTELSCVIDAVFEGFINAEKANKWPARAIDSIPVGADISPQRIKDIVTENENLHKSVWIRFHESMRDEEACKIGLLSTIGEADVDRPLDDPYFDDWKNEYAEEAADEFCAAISKSALIGVDII